MTVWEEREWTQAQGRGCTYPERESRDLELFHEVGFLDTYNALSV